MADEIRPTMDGACSGEECGSYDGKRCRLTGFTPRSCEPGWRALRACAEAAERERDGLRGALDVSQARAEAAEAEVERYRHSMEVATDDVNKAERERDEARGEVAHWNCIANGRRYIEAEAQRDAVYAAAMEERRVQKVRDESAEKASSDMTRLFMEVTAQRDALAAALREEMLRTSDINTCDRLHAALAGVK
jgi:hypothetical protein